MHKKVFSINHDDTFDSEAEQEEPLLTSVDSSVEEETDISQISYTKKTIDAKMFKYSLFSSSRFFCKHSCRDISRRKFHFGLSFCSVLIVVWSALVINTLVEKGPIIFLKLSESITG
jgi:hypothetical protein